MNGNNIITHTPGEKKLVTQWFADLNKLKNSASISREQHNNIYDRYVNVRNMVADHLDKKGKNTVNATFSSFHNKFKGGKKTRKSKKSRKNSRQ